MVSLKDEEIFAEEIHKYFCLFEKKKKKKRSYHERDVVRNA